MNRNNKPARIIKGTAKTPTLKDASGVWTLDEALQAHRANAWPQPNLFQPVSNSLRLKTASSTALVKQVGRPGNQRTWTWSGWVKRGLVDLNYHSFFCGGNASDYIAFWNDNSLVVSNFNGTDYIVRTTQLFRDPSAWYHLVITMDTTQATSSNRIKIYVNGSQVTSFAESTYPSQNYTTKFNASTVQYLGYNEYNYFDGQLGEVNFVDGYALDPRLFGKFDTDNTWVPVPYTGTYGTNGFYLPFTNATTSQTLGYDASLTGTTIYDADRDPYRGHVALHLTGNGPAGGQNNSFVESSSNNHPITRSGSVTQGSFSPFTLPANTPYNPAVHGASAYFGTTTSDNIYASPSQYNNSLAIGTNNFTIEFWINWSTWAGEQRYVLMGQAGSSNIEIGRTTAGGNTLNVYTNTSAKISVSFTPSIGAWYHIAVVRTGTGAGQLILYINGVSTATGTSADSIAANNFFVGGLNWATGYNHIGYISSLRVINGAAVYTAAFTPPTRPFGTLTNNLIPFSDYLLDSSSQLSGATAILAPALDGSLTGIKLIESTTTGGKFILQDSPVTTGITYIHSVYVKAEERKFFQMAASSGFANSNDFWVNYDLVNGTYSIQGANVLNGTASIISVGNGWFRCTISSIAQSTTSGRYVMAITNSLTATRLPSTTGDGISGLFLCWPQLEVGTTTTTYTPTPANYSTAPSLLLNFANAAVTDTAGAQNFVTTTNASITAASKYGQGALYFDGSASTFLSTPYNDRFSIGSSDYTVEFWCNLSAYGEIVGAFNLTSPFPGWLVNVGNFGSGGGTIGFFHANATVNQTVNSTNTVPLNTWTHIAVVKQNNFLKMFINGKLDSGHSLTLTSTGSGQQINIGSDANSLTAPGRRITGSLDDLRITKGVARYQADFTPPARALPVIGGKSFTTVNVNAGVVRRFTLDNLNIVGAKIYHVTTAQRSANYTVQYSDDNSTWTTAFGGVMSSMDGTVGIKVGTVTSGGSGTTGTGAWGPHLYWRYVEGSAINGHHPRCSRIIFTDSTGRDFNFKVFVTDNSSDIGEYQLGTKTGIAQSPTVNTSWTAPSDVTQVEVLVVAGGGGGGGEQETPAGAGGGAGGVIYNSTYPVTPGQTYTVTVGAPGSGGLGRAVGSNGANSVFGSLTAIGGGGGGFYAGLPTSGGSGGGAGWRGAVTSGASGTAGQGFAGGTVTEVGSLQGAGGGGGAGAVGDNASGRNAGAGGAGLRFGISGSPTFYAGGGGGGGGFGDATPGTGGAGGSSVGGAGSTAVDGGAIGGDAVPNSGGGGGGAGADNAPSYTQRVGGSGGAGVVIVRYTTQSIANTSDATTDNLVDSPTQYGHDYGNGGEVVGNYATLNPISSPPPYGQASPTLANGNLTHVGVSGYTNADGSIAITSGTFFYEVTLAGAVTDAEAYLMGVNSPGGYFRTAGIRGNGAVSGLTITTGSTFSYGVGDVIGIAFNYDTTVITYFKNGAQQCTTTNNSGAFTRPMAPWIQSGGNASIVFHCNFGQRPWAYAPPAGYGALTTKNLPRLTNAAAIAPNQYFGVSTWTQGATDVTLINDGGFQPDFVWIKSRANSQNHYLMDSVRGTTSLLRSNGTGAESTGSTWITFNSNGFTPSSANTVTNTYTYVAWQWKAGGAAVANTSGTITSQVSANTVSGFSIVTFTGTGVAATIGHGLGVAPSMVVIKQRNGINNWPTWHTGIPGGTGYYVYWDSTNGLGTSTTVFNGTNPTSSVFSVGTNSLTNGSTNTYVAYCWAEIAGFSKIGSYTGNGNVDGPFVYCGFKPAYIMIKNTTSAATVWFVFDSKRSTYNPVGNEIYANDLDIEYSPTNRLDFLSNGFKVRNTSTSINTASDNYIFMAFAEKPFGNVNGTAR